MISLVVLYITIASAAAASVRETPGASCFEEPQRCFLMSSKPLMYDEAVQFCTNNGEGKLVTFLNEKKYQLTMSYVRGELDKTQQENWLEFFWTGMQYQTDNGNAEISNGVEGYSSWYPGQPTNLQRHPQYTQVSVIVDQDGSSYYQGMANVPSSYVYFAVCQTTEF